MAIIGVFSEQNNRQLKSMFKTNQTNPKPQKLTESARIDLQLVFITGYPKNSEIIEKLNDQAIEQFKANLIEQEVEESESEHNLRFVFLLAIKANYDISAGNALIRAIASICGHWRPVVHLAETSVHTK